MSTINFNGLLIISIIVVAAPILAARVRRVRAPSAVVEIVAGILVGPSVLGWVKTSQPSMRRLPWPGSLAFFGRVRRSTSRRSPRSELRGPTAGFVASNSVLGTVAGVVFDAVDGSATRSSLAIRQCPPPP